MKTLLLVRHAKTEADSKSGKDFDRVLTERGQNDAAAMAQRIFDQKVQLDVLVTSTAHRAMETAQAYYKLYKSGDTVLIEKPELYHAEPSVYYEVIKGLDDKWKKAAVFAHNPGITEMANDLGVAHVDSMPTAGVFAVTADVTEWAEFAKAEKRFLFFDSPKMTDDSEKK